MNQEERLNYLINELIKEYGDELQHMEIPASYKARISLLRGLMNLRDPKQISDKFIKIQDEYLQEEIKKETIVDVNKLPTVKEVFKNSNNKHKDKLVLYKGDITNLKVDAIVNAANSQMLGCFVPNHKCIDNAIHSKAGLQLREECNVLMKKQGHLEATGSAKITNAYNLPSSYVIHTVGPIIKGKLTEELCDDLRSSYISCLKLADENNLKSIAFCCISTGEFGFPNKEAAHIAIKAIDDYLDNNDSNIEKVIINVFKEVDFEIYKSILE